MDTDTILVNGMRTPDGTEIFSRYRHDFVTHVDENGETYMVDGGTAYLRRSVNDEKPTDLSVYATGEHEHDRQHFHWGTRGPEGNEPLTWKPLAAMSTDHIKAILNTQKHVQGTDVGAIFIAELRWRQDLE